MKQFRKYYFKNQADVQKLFIPSVSKKNRSYGKLLGRGLYEHKDIWEKINGECVDITFKELEILDEVEENYNRKLVKLESGNSAWVYMLKEENVLK
jgi:gamma-glutamylcyclotransferase (GGCT)/AIG2-like uncharacterized protein YtfP